MAYTFYTFRGYSDIHTTESYITNYSTLLKNLMNDLYLKKKIRV